MYCNCCMEHTNNYFMKNGRAKFLISGEIHYFRINPKYWKKHLKLLKESGADTVSTYIPWDWHEIEEDKFDFDGKTDPARNITRFIELCKNEKLKMIVKPGPYILAEYKNQGLPSWLLKRLSKNAFALDESGNIISPDLVSYLSDEFLDYAFKWYDKVLPIISVNQIKNGGPISMMQVCNEIGVFQWLSGKVDYNPKVQKMFNEFLKKKYKIIEELNFNYSSSYSNFEEVKTPSGKIKTKSDYCTYYDFHLFFRHYFKEYISLLKNKIRSFGIEIQLTHNIPGWIYGNASELPMLISTYTEIMKNHPDIIFGLDHIPEFVSYRNAHSDLACNKILEALQPNAPVWAAEFQAGTREHQVKAYANELETFYFASLAHGLKGFNYYMFSQGINPKGKGYYGKTFYFQTALNNRANKNKLYDSIKKVNSFIRKNESELVQSKTNSDIAVGIYLPYFYTELTTSQLLKEKRLDVNELGLYLDPRFIREEIFFNGLLRSLQTLNYSYDVFNLESGNISKALEYRQLWVVSTEFMDENTQEFLAEYVLNGGNLVLYPTVPQYNLYLNKCDILQRKLNLDFKTELSGNLIDFMDIEDVFTVFPQKIVFNEPEKHGIACTDDNKICAISKKVGKGKLTVLGFTFGYTSDEHLEVYDRFIKTAGIKSNFLSKDKDLQVTVRIGEKYKFIFILNYHNEKKIFSYKKNNYLIKPYSYHVIKERLN